MKNYIVQFVLVLAFVAAIFATPQCNQTENRKLIIYAKIKFMLNRLI